MQGAGGGTAWGELRRDWATLAGATLGVAMGASGLTFYTAGLFVGRYEHEFGWSRTDLSLLSLAGTVILAVIAPIAGAVMDRFGVRGPAAVSFTAVVAGYGLTSLLSGSFAQYVALQLVLTCLVACSTPIAFTRPVNAAFDRMRGLALGITIGGTGLAATFAPAIVAGLIEGQGWRVALRHMGVWVALAAPVVLILLSLRPHGRRLPPAPAGVNRAAVDWRDPLLWRLCAAFALVALAVSGFVLHFAPMLTDRGLTLAKAAEIQGLLGIAVLVGRLGVGAAMDRVFAPFVGAGLLLLSAAGFVALAIGGTPFAFAAALAVGLAIGAEVDLIAYLTARYYSMQRYGRMYGIFYGSFLLGTGVSPYLIARVQGAAASYVPALWLSTGLLVAAATLFATAPRFQAAANGPP